MKKSGRSKPKNLFEELSKKLCSLFLIALAYLGYVAEIRISIQNNFGAYFTGFTDCLVISATLIIAISYLLSRIPRITN
jgi:hypothetical protein